MIKRLLVIFVALGAVLGLSFWLTKSGIHPLDEVANAATPKAPELIGNKSDWLNTPGNAPFKLYSSSGILADDPLAPGKHPVILVDFWEYTCINCLHTLPYVKDWANRYKSSGLIVIGIHTPEFTFGHESANVAAAVKRLGIEYPVLIDSNYDNWNAYNNQSWPADYILDEHGHIVDSQVGEGNYAGTEHTLRQFLLEANPGEALPPAYGDPATGQDISFDITPELYAGASRGQIQNPEGFGSGNIISYANISPENWSDGYLAVNGQWLFTGEYAQHVGTNPSDYVGVRYHAKAIVAVIKPDTGLPFNVVVLQDGAPVATADAGSDIHYTNTGSSYITIDAPREYDIVKNTVAGAHTLALYPMSDKFRLYSFCFSPT
jgi:thiol-disulfide isomerase/thioredoxin